MVLGEQMTNNEKRRYCGCFMPNIFFLLQVCMTLLLLLVSLELLTVLDMSPFLGYVYVVIAIMAVAYFANLRKKVIQRQYQHCDEYADKKGEKID